MKEILLLCLTRFGDLIEATPLLRGLREAHPDARITLAVIKNFTGILPLIRGYDRTFVFDKSEAARRVSCGDDPLAAYRHMEEFISSLEQEHYDLIVNLNTDKLSAYIISVLNGSRVSGITVAESDQRLINGLWGIYIVSVILGDYRKFNRINLVDIFTKMGGINPNGQPVELHETEAGRLFADRFIEEYGLAGEQLVGIQLGASDSIRCWPPEGFAKLSDLLQSRAGVRTVLFGSLGEQELAAQAVTTMQIAPINAVGKTGIEELFSLVKRCSFLVTNDTGTMHFAAAGGIPVIMLSLGPAFFHCSGPYSAGNLALQPKLHCSPCRYSLNCLDPVCRTVLSVEVVHNACRLLLGETVDLSEAFTGVEVYRSRFAPDGYLEWQALCNQNVELEEFTKLFANLWKDFLDGKVPLRPERLLNHPSELELLSRRGMLLTSQIMEAARKIPLPVKLIASLGEKEAALEAEIKMLGSCNPAMAPLVDFLTLIRENITDGDLHSIALQTHNLYEQGQRLAALLQIRIQPAKDLAQDAERQ